MNKTIVAMIMSLPALAAGARKDSKRTCPTGKAWLVSFATTLALLAPGVASGADVSANAAAPTPIAVQTREVPPFAYRDADRNWHGIAVDLWNAIAADLGLDSHYEPITLDALLEGLTDGRIAVAVGALSVTAEREAQFDFSHPYYRATLGVAVPDERIDGWQRFLRAVSSPTFLGAVTALLTLLATVGALVWLAERRHNSQFPHDLANGVGAGIWWSSVTMTTVGYGDKSPITFRGRLIAMIWMFTSLIIVSTVTASLTASFTVDALSTTIESESELASVRNGTVAGSTSEIRLNARGIRPRLYPSLEMALAALAAGEIEAVVYDRPLLRYSVAQDYVGTIRVLPLEFAPQDYAFAFEAGSPLREQVNRRLLVHGRGVEWDRLVTRYLGREH
ncbi:MAG: transporter substrate-binding domain-containing protein [Burkholderiaceae bacterium]